MWAWIPWEKAMIPSLLSRCCNWVGITQKTVDLLDEIQNQYVTSPVEDTTVLRQGDVEGRDILSRDEAQIMEREVAVCDTTEEVE